TLDRHRRRDRIEPVDRGPGEPLEELPRIGAEALHVAALPLGVERPERERRLARAGHAANRHERAGLDVEIEPAQVVRAGTAQAGRAHVRTYLGGRGEDRAGPSSRAVSRAGPRGPSAGDATFHRRARASPP